MRLGVLARIEVARGIAIQTRSFIENMPVSDILKVVVHPIHGDIDDPWPTAQAVGFGQDQPTLDERVVREFLRRNDIVFSVETVYDWRLTQWAREEGTKVVVQGNPEFYRHGQPKGPTKLQQPDEWWWPTTWRMGFLPAGPLMPCPMPGRPFQPEQPAIDGWPLRVLHVIGKRAWKDRNGTEIFLQAMRNVTEPVHATIYTIDGELPELPRCPNVTWSAHPHGVDDRWEMYRDQDVLVLPRKFGGNCLPALEAQSCGVAVMMPECSPNDEHAQILTKVSHSEQASLQCGPVQMAIADPYSVAEALDHLARHRSTLHALQEAAYRNVGRWEQWRPRYLTRLEHLCS